MECRLVCDYLTSPRALVVIAIDGSPTVLFDSELTQCVVNVSDHLLLPSATDSDPSIYSLFLVLFCFCFCFFFLNRNKT